MGKQKNKRTSSGFVMVNENIEILVSFGNFMFLTFYPICCTIIFEKAQRELFPLKSSLKGV